MLSLSLTQTDTVREPTHTARALMKAQQQKIVDEEDSEIKKRTKISSKQERKNCGRKNSKQMHNPHSILFIPDIQLSLLSVEALVHLSS